MSALPEYFGLRLAQRWQARHRPRCRDSGPYFPTRVAKQKLDRTQVAGATVDQGRLRAAERVRGKDVRVHSDARDPFCDEPRVLPCCHGITNPPAAGEQKFAWHLAGRLEVVVTDVLADPDYSLRDVQQKIGFRTI